MKDFNNEFMTVNFGTGKTGLSTVGYTLYDKNGVAIGSRVTSGVSELGSTGIYFAEVALDRALKQLVVWDTGEGSPRYAAVTWDSQAFLTKKQTDDLRPIWNWIQNQGEAYQKIMSGLKKIGKIEDKDKGKDVKDILNIVKKLEKKEPATLSEIESKLLTALSTVKVPAPKMPDIPTPKDHTKQLENIANMLATLSSHVGRLPKQYESTTTKMDDILLKLDEQVDAIPTKLKPMLAGVLIEVSRFKKLLENDSGRIKDIHDELEKIMGDVKPTKLLLDIFNMTKTVENGEVKDMNRLKRLLGVQ